MKISYCSDLHLEHGPIDLDEFYNNNKSEILVLAGDICVASRLAADESEWYYHKSIVDGFLRHCSSEWNHVIMICGNHESYGGIFQDTYKVLKERYKNIQNLYFLDNETIKIGDVRFVGGTMWSDCNNGDPMTLLTLGYNMNDFIVIKNSYEATLKQDIFGVDALVLDKFRPEQAWGEFLKFCNYLESVLKANPEDKICMVTHHAPSKRSTHPRYKDDYELNGGYSSDLDDLIEGYPQIKLAIHGHTHSPFDYMIGETRVVCNPRGYINSEKVADYFEIKTVEI